MADQNRVEPFGARVVNRTADEQFGNLRDERTAQGSRFMRRIKAEKKAFLGLILVVVLAIVAAFGPWLAPYGADNTNFDILAAPSLHHPMGTDSFGHDLFSRVILGTRVSFTIGIVGALLSMVIGVTIGIVAGYYGGWIDNLSMRIVDLIW
ncbi:MAG TPA: hypothetical protein VHV31_10905, partial [Nitrolancea sp.]|nr:hypothetical protein [Nitrolancea sp.]